MALPPYAVTFRGKPACPCQATWLPAFEAEAQRRGILSGPLPLSQLIGGADASWGTHTDGGADDTCPLDGIDVEAYVALSRQMGADATWHRPQGWDGHNGVSHVHRVLTGCPHNGPARYQIDAVKAGYNGLGYGGHAARDDGPRPLSGRTWQEGLTWARNQREKDDDLMAFSDWSPEEKQAFRDFIQKSVRATEIQVIDPRTNERVNGRLDWVLRDIKAGIDALEKEH